MSSNYEVEVGKKLALEFYSKGCPATAILCVNDMVAFGVIKELSNLGVRIPTDVSIIGFDDSLVSRVIEPELTTVRIDSYRLGELAAKLLFQLIDGQTLRQDRITISTELIVRGTT